MTAPLTSAGRSGLPLRAWQTRAIDAYLARHPRDFLAVATPGAGKTRFALVLATHLLDEGVVQAVTIVTPTEHLKRQWALAAHAHDLRIDPEFANAAGRASREFTGVAVTYAQVATAPLLHRARTEARRTLVVLDEIHHAGDAKSWGEAVREAFEPATRRLALTGTPFRSDDSPIPFVTYSPGPDGLPRSQSDTSYGYGEALRDGVVRPVIFIAYSGEMRWRTSAGTELSARLGEPLTDEATAHAWRTALDPAGEWIPKVLRAADHRLSQVREHVPDAGGLVIAADHATARAYAVLLRRICDQQPTLVLSDDPQASRKIAQFARSAQRWMVAVRMVSEGVVIGGRVLFVRHGERGAETTRRGHGNPRTVTHVQYVRSHARRQRRTSAPTGASHAAIVGRSAVRDHRPGWRDPRRGERVAARHAGGRP